MAGSLNKVMIIGNLGRDPEVRHTQDGKPIANLNIATTESWKDKNSGEKQEKTEWHRVVIFGPVADVAQKWLKKGSSVYIEGKMQTRKWTDAQGQEKYTTEVVVDGFNGQMTMLGGRNDNAGGGYSQDNSYNQEPVQQSAPKPAPAMQPAPVTNADAPFDDEIPF